jgi:hypothetical protein
MADQVHQGTHPCTPGDDAPPRIPDEDNAALAFYEAACVILEERGERANRTVVAEIVGTHRAGLSRSIRGENGITVQRLIRWMRAWRGAGYRQIRLKITSKGVE